MIRSSAYYFTMAFEPSAMQTSLLSLPCAAGCPVQVEVADNEVGEFRGPWVPCGRASRHRPITPSLGMLPRCAARQLLEVRLPPGGILMRGLAAPNLGRGEVIGDVTMSV